MQNRQCDIFISYRRDGGDMTAMYIFQELKDRGYQAFYDVEVLRSGKFNEALLANIRACKDFILILSPHALDRCINPDDWVRQEIAEAIRLEKNIVPILLNGFQFPEELPKEIDSLRFHTGLTSNTEYFQESMDRLCDRFLISKPKKKKSPAAVIAAVVLLLCAGGFLAFRYFYHPSLPGAGQTAGSTAVFEQPVPEASPEPKEELAKETALPSASVQENTGAPKPLRYTDLPVITSDVETNPETDDESGWPAMGNPAYQRSSIHSITFLPGMDSAAEDAWDISAAGDRSVLAWVIPNGDLYDLYVAGDGGVRLLDSPDLTQIFSGYSNAVSISFNGCLDMSEREDIGHFFWGCNSLKEIDFSGISTENVRNMNGVFGGCWALRTLDLSFMDTSRVTNMSEMFLDCENLRVLDLSGLDTSKVQDMSSMFLNCRRIDRIDVSAFDTSSVTSMKAMFDQCNSLAELDLQNWNTAEVKDFSNMFAFCETLERLDLRSFSTASAENMESMFEGCSNLKEVLTTGWDASFT